MEPRKADKYLVRADLFERVVGVLNELPAKHVRVLINELEATTQAFYNTQADDAKSNVPAGEPV